MKRSLWLAAFLTAAGAAEASPITFVDVHDPSDVFLNSRNSVYSFWHDINDNGFDRTLDHLTSASISLDFRDDGDSTSEYINFRLDGDNFGTYEVDSYPDMSFFVDVSYLQNDGLLNVTLRAKSGDVWFAKSTLTVNGEHTVVSPVGRGGGAAVPEPSTLFLLGLGASAAGLRRRRTRESTV